MSGSKSNKVLIIGAHGMLGRPVARRLVQDGFQVAALARQPDKAKKVLPETVVTVAGDLKSVESIDRALQGCQAVYVSVDTLPGARFRAETDGLRNVVAASKNHAGVRLMVLSALRGSDPRAKEHPWWHAREKYEAQQIAKESGLPFTIFEPSWFMESIPLLVKHRILLLFQTHLVPFWVAGDDLGRMVSAALRKNAGVNEIIPVQGPDQISLPAAAARFVQAFDPSIFVLPTPMWTLKWAGTLIPRLRELAALFDLMEDIPENQPDPSIWEKLEKPIMTITDYAAYVKATKDFPQK